MHASQVLANQRAVKLKAESQGILLRPRDPNSSVGADAIGNKLGGKPSAVIGAGFKRTNGILGAAGRGSRGGGGDDPLAKKVKVRFPRSGGVGEEGSATGCWDALHRLFYAAGREFLVVPIYPFTVSVVANRPLRDCVHGPKDCTPLQAIRFCPELCRMIPASAPLLSRVVKSRRRAIGSTMPLPQPSHPASPLVPLSHSPAVLITLLSTRNRHVCLIAQTMSAVEKELLLRRVSKYAGLAEEVSGISPCRTGPPAIITQLFLFLILFFTLFDRKRTPLRTPEDV